jgi:hypothetical protein
MQFKTGLYINIGANENEKKTLKSAIKEKETTTTKTYIY